MPKPLRRIIPNQKGYTPKAGDEKKFAALHKVDVYADRNGNGDDVFKGSRVKAFDRAAHRFGYNPGEDKKAEFVAGVKGEETNLDEGSFAVSSENMQKGYWKIYHTGTGKTHKVLTTKSVAQNEADQMNKESIKTKKEETELDEAEQTDAATPVGSISDSKFHHNWKFKEHHEHAISCSNKACNAEDEGNRLPLSAKNEGLRHHHSSIAEAYRIAAAHHLRLADHHAKKAGIKIVKEEELDEVSRSLVRDYMSAAKHDRGKAHSAALGSQGYPNHGYFKNEVRKRTKGLKLADIKMTPTKKTKVPATEETQLDEAATRKDFRDVANTVRAIEDPKKRQEYSDHHAAIFAKQNSRFDYSKWHAAAGTQNTSPGPVVKNPAGLGPSKKLQKFFKQNEETSPHSLRDIVPLGEADWPANAAETKSRDNALAQRRKAQAKSTLKDLGARRDPRKHWAGSYSQAKKEAKRTLKDEFEIDEKLDHNDPNNIRFDPKRWHFFKSPKSKGDPWNHPGNKAKNEKKMKKIAAKKEGEEFDPGELVFEAFSESAQPVLYRIHSDQEGKQFHVWKCANPAVGFEKTEDVFDNEYDAMIYTKNLMTAEHNASVKEEEELDEVSKEKKAAYLDAASKDLSNIKKARVGSGAPSVARSSLKNKIIAKRTKGIAMASEEDQKVLDSKSHKLKGSFKHQGHEKSNIKSGIKVAYGTDYNKRPARPKVAYGEEEQLDELTGKGKLQGIYSKAATGAADASKKYHEVDRRNPDSDEAMEHGIERDKHRETMTRANSLISLKGSLANAKRAKQDLAYSKSQVKSVKRDRIYT